MRLTDCKGHREPCVTGSKDKGLLPALATNGVDDVCGHTVAPLACEPSDTCLGPPSQLERSRMGMSFPGGAVEGDTRPRGSCESVTQEITTSSQEGYMPVHLQGDAALCFPECLEWDHDFLLYLLDSCYKTTNQPSFECALCSHEYGYPP